VRGALPGLPPEGREWRKPAKMGVRTSRAAKDMLSKDWKDGSSQVMHTG